MGKAEHLVEVGTDDDDGHTLARQIGDDLINGGARADIDARVGSSRMTTFGSRRMLLAMTTFC